MLRGCNISLPADLNVTFFGNLTIAGQGKNGNFCQILVANPEITLNTDGVIEIYQPFFHKLIGKAAYFILVC